MEAWAWGLHCSPFSEFGGHDGARPGTDRAPCLLACLLTCLVKVPFLASDLMGGPLPWMLHAPRAYHQLRTQTVDIYLPFT